MIMRQEKTLKPVANFIVQDNPLCELIPMKTNDKSFVWSCSDYSDEEAKIEKLALRLQTLDNAALFRDAFNAAKLFNKLLREGAPDEALVFAATVEDKEEVVEDDADKNVGAEEAAGD